MAKTIGKLGAVSYALAGLCFFLTFVEFSCGGQRVMSFSGIRLVTGTSIQQPSVVGPPQEKKVSAVPAAIVAFVAVIAGVLLGFAGSRPGLATACISGIVGTISLFVLKAQMDSEVAKGGGGLIRVEYAAPFWIASVLAVVGAIGTGFAASEKDSELDLRSISEARGLSTEGAQSSGPAGTVHSAAPPEPPFTLEKAKGVTDQQPIAPGTAVATAGVYCSECGAKSASDARFCEECGTEL